MDSTSCSQTSPTLLARLRQEPDSQAAWEQFVARYGPQIHGWCRQWRLQEADAEDITQLVLVTLVQRMRTFTYDSSGSFRGWLRTVTHHAWGAFASRWERGGRASGDSKTLEALHTLAARDDLVARLETQFDREILEEASARVQLRVAPSSWEAFRSTALEGMSGADAAQKLGMQVWAVFKAKARVQQMLQEEIARLEGGAA
jgi:RNA polymerase sigma-70 factor (ECF subfamily)